MALHKWIKIGEPEILAEKFGRKFFRQNFVNPINGAISDFYLFSMKDSSFVFPMTDDGKVITVCQYKQGCHDITHELPAGVCNTSEPHEVTAKRELLEETGYEAKEMIPMGVGWPDTRSTTIQRFFFLANGCRKVKEPEQDPNEEIEVVLYDMPDWLDMIKSNEVKELTTISITLHFILHLGIFRSVLFNI